jgi:hypothetical protein
MAGHAQQALGGQNCGGSSHGVLGLVASPARLIAARIVEPMVDQADGLLGGVHMRQLDPVVRFIESYEFVLEMAGLAVNRRCGAWAVPSP